MEEKKALLAVLAIQLVYAGYFLLTKLAFDVGMNTFVFVFYRQAAATLFLLPIAISLQRITMSLDIVGVGLKYTSASLGAATSNTLPVITFFLALLLGMEKVKIRRECVKELSIKVVVDNPTMLVKHFTGIVVTGFTFYLQTWVVEKKGPVYLSMTTPWIMVFTIILSAFVFGEIIALGSVIGAILLVGGLYFVLWGKAKEEEMEKEECQQIVDVEKACGESEKMGGCSSRSMLETVDLDDELDPLPAPENQETPVNGAGKVKLYELCHMAN
ncbi:hypothetical protein SASPL_145147 [Salvia splendens]|uniref:WAT1-related protein n=1 Tax=Salvia splendens TaxID=180675 RepID=A0A8X8Z7T6_SALSN|nr:hypothetical protein SASPL_145147 [Salvia splendens]